MLDTSRISTAHRKAMYYEKYSGTFGDIYPVFLGSELVAVLFEKPHLKVSPIPEAFKEELRAYFAGESREFKQKVAFITGTEFEQRVWEAIRSIPYGETRSYKWLAEEVGSPKGMRAVGQALSKNPLPIVVPCHRIIEASGRIGGYSSGQDIKRRLLMMECYNTPGCVPEA